MADQKQAKVNSAVHIACPYLTVARKRTDLRLRCSFAPNDIQNIGSQPFLMHKAGFKQIWPIFF